MAGIHQYRSGLPSLTSTNTLPPSPREIRTSSSRKVVNNHDCALSAWIGNFNGGWPDMVLATDIATCWRGRNRPRIGVKSTFWPMMSTSEGTSMESVSFGVPMTPSSNLICSQVYTNIHLLDVSKVLRGTTPAATRGKNTKKHLM